MSTSEWLSVAGTLLQVGGLMVIIYDFRKVRSAGAAMNLRYIEGEGMVDVADLSDEESDEMLNRELRRVAQLGGTGGGDWPPRNPVAKIMEVERRITPLLAVLRQPRWSVVGTWTIVAGLGLSLWSNLID